MTAWLNSDGLRVKFGLEEAVQTKVAGYRTHGPKRFVEILIDADWLPDFGDSEILNYQVALPDDALIEQVEKSADTEAFTSGGSATLSVDLVDQESPYGNAVALVDAITVAELNENTQTNTAGWIGSGVGTRLNGAKIVQVSVGTADFTAGRATFRVYYSIPKPQDGDTLIWNKSA